MKPTNPMAQLQQWKDSRNAKMLSANTNQSKIGVVKNTQGEAHRETKSKYQGKLSINPLVVEYSQLTRQFKLIHDSNRKCLEVYPDDFHHKLKMRGECVDLVERLKGGGKLFNELAKAADLTKEQAALLKAFNQVNGYLIYKFSEVAEQIDQLNIERVEEQKTTDSKMN
ncbi:hypothetical protein [Aggregatibacter actinomycetemcomitans]|uniref:hypothetical protein n=1 Tax=Aggregatibacter actinomycetemcomitans TaxID=714 RepID=UPI0006A732A1|nr:hypothetical protein [Aggregatibacter actinomycetemcomitans]KOE63223.1 hypothetical protein D17P2_0300905 [Aggregatibacter actinomycetemcomitans serotype c str. D17P-2]